MIQRNMYKVYMWEKLPSSSVKNSHGMPLCLLTGWRVEPWGWGQCLLWPPSILHWLQKVPTPREISGHTPQWPRGVQKVSLGTTIFRVARKLALATVISHIKAKVKAFLKLVELEEATGDVPAQRGYILKLKKGRKTGEVQPTLQETL